MNEEDFSFDSILKQLDEIYESGRTSDKDKGEDEEEKIFEEIKFSKCRFEDDDNGYENPYDDPWLVKEKENLEYENKFAVGLDAVYYRTGENAEYGEEDLLSKELRLRVSTWMAMYNNLDEPEDFALMRDISIGIAETLCNFKVKANEFGSFVEKYKATEPYHFFLTTVPDQPSTYDQPYSVTFHEIIDHTLGVIVDSLHVNCFVELSWIITEYMIACQNPKMTIIFANIKDPDTIDTNPFDIELQQIHLPNYGCMHSKLSIFKYKNEQIRIVVSTANLYAIDWITRTQGLWISPLLPRLPLDADHTDGDSVTNFKKDLIEYLSQHNEEQIFGWISLLYQTDFSSIKVFFIGSVPGKHTGSALNKWGQNKLKTVLSEHAILPDNAREWPVVAQCSAVGSFGPNYLSWLSSVVHSMSGEKKINQEGNKIVFLPEFKFIFPSQENYLGCYDDGLGGSCLLYSEELHEKQQWIKEHLYRWQADKTERTFAMPHIKCYTRISQDLTEIPWFVVTSTNLGKGGWGKNLYNPVTLSITNYEAGIIFIPKLLIDRDTFPIAESNSLGAPLFTLPFDVPLTPYRPRDDPYFTPEPQPPKQDEPSETCDPNLEESNVEEIENDT